MKRRSTFRFRPPWSQPAPASAPAPFTPANDVATSTIAQSGPSSPPGVSSSPSSQPLIPSQEQQGISSQLVLSYREHIDQIKILGSVYNPRVPPSPSPSPSRSPEMNPISSPTRNDPSTDQLTSKVPPHASQSISSNLPSGITSQMQQKDQTIAQPTSPLKQLDNSEPKLTAIRPQSVRSPEKIMQPLKLTESETNIQETRQVKEVVQEMSDKNGENIASFLTSKKQPDIVFQSKQDMPLNKKVKDNNISKFIHRMAVGEGKKNLEEGPASVITLAGDNRGAYMQIRRGYKLNPDESAYAEGNSEGRRQKMQGPWKIKK
ncbi:hypothetical protein A4A49_43457 [Nicotiana attenuata]|uniref:Uncharacterized protein n=1 Tax=Nicotiana attenuata TaxID=49451 RepID=A0A1J6JUU8_NICAT|nr:hypothetical protein A4A49_60484 [Nicotiana attenuata]OIT20934.1 hypothetical protein A4A49_43457 [Nicotiana attenuata]